MGDHTGHAPKTLHAHLGQSPEFFIEIISSMYRRRGDRDGQDQPEPTQKEQFVANQAFRLLRAWKEVPGTSEDGNVDESALREWCREVRRLAEECELVGKCNDAIGQVFAHAPEDVDGTWPCNSVRRIAEEIGTGKLASGFYCGIINSRGAGFRASGGDQDRELAQQFRDKSDRIRFDAPFAARILDDVAQTYEREAKMVGRARALGRVIR